MKWGGLIYCGDIADDPDCVFGKGRPEVSRHSRRDMQSESEAVAPVGFRYFGPSVSGFFPLRDSTFKSRPSRRRAGARNLPKYHPCRIVISTSSEFLRGLETRRFPRWPTFGNNVGKWLWSKLIDFLVFLDYSPIVFRIPV